MLNSDEQAFALADLFYGAALGTNSWYEALDALAKATGSRTGQLIAIGANALVPLNVMTNTDPELHPDFAAKRGGDPTINPRVKAGLESPVLAVMAERDFITPEEHATHPHYEDFARRWDIPYICLATLDRHDGVLVGLAVNRSENEGHITASERAVFEAIVPHARAAVRMQMALDNERLKILSGTLEALGIAAFVCQVSGRVHSMTPAAETLATSGTVVQIKNGLLQAANESDQRPLADAIERAALGSALQDLTPTSVVLRATTTDIAPLIVDVIRLPSRTLEINSEVRILIVPQGGATGEARRRALLRTIYKLTDAEMDVALQLSQGRTAEVIAADRDVAIATVRAQIKSILAKFGMTRQVELVARLGQL